VVTTTTTTTPKPARKRRNKRRRNNNFSRVMVTDARTTLSNKGDKPFLYLDPQSAKRPPWGGSNKTVSMCNITHVDVLTDANGAAAFFFIPGLLKDAYCTATTITSGVVMAVSSGVDVSNYSTMTSSFSGYRVCSCLVEFLFTYNNYDNQGVATMKTFSGYDTFNSMLSYGTIPTTQESIALQSKMFPVKEGGYCYPPIADMVEAKEFNLLNTITTRDQFSSVAFQVSGAKASTVIGKLVIRQNIEFIPKASELLTRLAKPSPSYSAPIVETARTVLGNAVNEIQNIGAGFGTSFVRNLVRVGAQTLVGYGARTFSRYLQPVQQGMARQIEWNGPTIEEL